MNLNIDNTGLISIVDYCKFTNCLCWVIIDQPSHVTLDGDMAASVR